MRDKFVEMSENANKMRERLIKILLDAENQNRRDRARLERDFLNLATARSDKKRIQKHLRSRF